MREGARPCLGRDRQKNAESTPADNFGATYNYILHDHLVLVIIRSDPTYLLGLVQITKW